MGIARRQPPTCKAAQETKYAAYVIYVFWQQGKIDMKMWEKVSAPTGHRWSGFLSYVFGLIIDYIMFPWKDKKSIHALIMLPA